MALEKALARLTGTAPSAQASATPETPRRIYPHPVMPRMILEVHRKDNILIGSNTPRMDVGGRLDVRELSAHIRSRLASQTFLGFIVTCLVEHEDMVTHIDLHPHIFRDRVCLFKPNAEGTVELCCLLSMLENCKQLSPAYLWSVLARARRTHEKTKGTDADFFMQGIETLAATAAFMMGFPPGPELRATPLLLFKLYKEFGDRKSPMGGLLKPIYLESFRLGDTGGNPEADNSFGSNSMNIFYCDTVFTKHLENRDVLKHLKICGLFKNPVSSLFLK
ncbi:ORF42 [Retroperitoneal fibromatosis-associated herpesvirus]|uniref:ORF42 n=1 Tax=Retroperitoneal fibromatosis-associated herpesvirus TaxID=111469 RepID=U5NM60_9GAMA|nr:ORF42 [Retroperitoneal fibromatosis-associated herpesvirus]AGY30723.1 ORF42 [Retroperitoneal fibromatosis-associated herpesvirus]